MFLSLHEPDTATVDPADCTVVPARPEAAYLLWGAITDSGSPAGRNSTECHRVATEMFGAWARPLRELIQAADRHSVGVFPYLAGDLGDRVPWAPGPVTALGDAIHAMPPTGGRGAATAIRDADHLVDHLGRVGRSQATVPQAIADYHRELADYAPAAVRASLRPLTWRRYLRHPVAFEVARRGLPIADRLRNRRHSSAAYRRVHL